MDARPVPAHLTDVNLGLQLDYAVKHGLTNMEAETKALLKLRPEQRREAWVILRDPWN